MNSPLMGYWIALLVLLYWVPSFVAFSRGHRNRWPILALNTFLGATVIGWVAALVWALLAEPTMRVQNPTILDHAATREPGFTTDQDDFRASR